MPVPLADGILAVVKEGLSLWKVFISTRQEAYYRQQDKKQIKAIECAEKYIFLVDYLISRIAVKYPSAKEDKDLQADLKDIARYRRTSRESSGYSYDSLLCQIERKSSAADRIEGYGIIIFISRIQIASTDFQNLCAIETGKIVIDV